MYVLNSFNYKFAAFLIFIASLVFTSCVTPVNLNFDSARMIDKKEVEIQPSASAYFLKESNSTNNLGLRIGYGISNRYNLKLRGEYMLLPFSTHNFSDTWVRGYVEIDNKIGFNKYLAMSIPIGGYFTSKGFIYGNFDPRLYITYPTKNNKFEASIVPKCHIIYGDGAAVMPGLSVGFGFSKNLDKWAIRPEFGYDYYLSFGIGATFNITKNTKLPSE